MLQYAFVIFLNRNVLITVFSDSTSTLATALGKEIKVANTEFNDKMVMKENDIIVMYTTDYESEEEDDRKEGEDVGCDERCDSDIGVGDEDLWRDNYVLLDGIDAKKKISDFEENNDLCYFNLKIKGNIEY